MSQNKSKSVTVLLRSGLSIVIILLILCAVYSSLFKSSHIKHKVFTASAFPIGNWTSEHENIVFRYFPETLMEIVQDDSTGDQYIHVELKKTENYKGFGITQDMSIPANSQLVLDWRFSGDTFGIQIDIKDREGSGTLGEVFTHILTPPENQWNLTTIPLSGFTRNDYQSPDNPNDGFLNHNAIQSVEVALPPNEELTIDIRQVYFTSSAPKNLFIFGMIVVSGLGILLLVRTSREFLTALTEQQFFSSPVSTRLIYMLAALALIDAGLNATLYVDWVVPVCIFSAYFCLILFDELNIVPIHQSKIGTYRFLGLFAIGWFFQFPATMIGLLFFMLAASVPIIERKQDLIIFVVMIGFVLFSPLLINNSVSFEVIQILYLFSLVIILLAFLNYLHQNILTKYRAENASTLYEELFNNTSDAIFSYDASGAIQDANLGFADMLDVNKSEIIGTKIYHWVFQEDQSLLPLHLEKQSNALREYDMRFLNQNGDIVYTNIIERTKQEDATSVTYQINARDITKWKEMEELKKEKIVAEQASEFKSNFISTMSHEMRTPLHCILGMVDVLSSNDLTEEQHKFLTMARKSGKDLLDLINNVLDFANIESGKLTLLSNELNLGLLIQETVTGIKDRAEKNGLEFAVTLPDFNNEYHLGDTKRIQQVLLNLLENAMKFTESGSITLNVTVLKDEPGFTRFRFEVTDTGIGVEQKNKDKIFEVFAQESTGSTRTYGGSGMGLAISKEFVHLMGGEIGVESEKGKGSTFWFEIPLQKDTDLVFN